MWTNYIFPAVLYFVLRIRANSLSSMAHDQMLMAIAIMCTVRVRTVRQKRKELYAAAGKTQYVELVGGWPGFTLLLLQTLLMKVCHCNCMHASIADVRITCEA